MIPKIARSARVISRVFSDMLTIRPSQQCYGERIPSLQSDNLVLICQLLRKRLGRLFEWSRPNSNRLPPPPASEYSANAKANHRSLWQTGIHWDSDNEQDQERRMTIRPHVLHTEIQEGVEQLHNWLLSDARTSLKGYTADADNKGIRG